MSNEGWIGVDLDGTLAYDHDWRGLHYVGDPIPAMQERVMRWISEGKTVKIFTARATNPEAIPPIKNWLRDNGFPDLEVTNFKDMHMIECWDDRSVQVVPNTGQPIAQPVAEGFALFNKIRDEQEDRLASGLFSDED